MNAVEGGDSGNVIRPEPFNRARPVEGFGGGSTSGPMEPSVSLKEYVDKADDAMESRVMAAVGKLPGMGTIWGGVATIVGAIFTALAITLGVIAFGGDRFDAGIGQADTRQAQIERDRQQDAKLDEILARLPKRPSSAASRP